VSDTATDTPALTSGGHQRVLDVLSRELGDALVEHVMERDELWVRVENAAWHRTFELCRRQLGLTWFCFLAGLDWLPISNSGEKVFTGEEAGDDEDAEATEEDPVDDGPTEMVNGVAGGVGRFQVFARVYDVTRQIGVTFKADLDEADPQIASIADLYRGADWHEREAWEFYGFTFDGHPGLRHLYLPGEFEGNPGRKDFPLLARELKPWPGLVNVEQIPDHLDPKKVEAARVELEAAAAAAGGGGATDPTEVAAAHTAEPDATTTTAAADEDVAVAAPGADAVPAAQAAEKEADRPLTPEVQVQQIAPAAAADVAEGSVDTPPATDQDEGGSDQ
jgi:NADH-quinone oxidoreductase subunit C